MNDLRSILKNRADLRKYLFVRGFLMTDESSINGKSFPFFGEWKCTKLGNFCVWTHRNTGFYWVDQDERIFFLFGHAYNPFTMEISESNILKRIAEHLGNSDFYDVISELTGIFVFGFIDGDKVSFLTDPSGMQSACAGVINGKFYLTSHAQLVADVLDLKMMPFIEELIHYKWYGRVMGPYLPADLTPFSELKRIVPNIKYSFTGENICHKRFYPLDELKQVQNEKEYDEVIREAAKILKNGMILVGEKWERPWISLTGGIDSNTTFAAANGIYNQFHTFSYLSAEKESIDCEAARKISAEFDVPWECYHIPTDSSVLADYEIKREIILHNNAYIAQTPENEIRKRIYLADHLPADVEVKSWVSETIRAYWYKHYGRKTMPPLSAKLYRNLYKIFILNRGLAHKIDRLFDKYIKEYEYELIPQQYPPADVHYNEVTWGSWGGLNISEMKFYSDITIIYNNRKFLDMLFRIPLIDRISDKHHLAIKKALNQKLYDMGIRIVNQHETAFRAFCLNAIFTANMILPF